MRGLFPRTCDAGFSATSSPTYCKDSVERNQPGGLILDAAQLSAESSADRLDTLNGMLFSNLSAEFSADRLDTLNGMLFSNLLSIGLIIAQCNCNTRSENRALI